MIMTAHMARMVRSSVIQVMASDYVQMAILKGVPYWKMVFKHVLPNALLPAINVVALTIAWLLGGVVVTEVVFNSSSRVVLESTNVSAILYSFSVNDLVKLSVPKSKYLK